MKKLVLFYLLGPCLSGGIGEKRKIMPPGHCEYYVCTTFMLPGVLYDDGICSTLGQLGIGTFGTYRARLKPQLLTTLHNVVGVSAGENNSVAVTR